MQLRARKKEKVNRATATKYVMGKLVISPISLMFRGEACKTEKSHRKNAAKVRINAYLLLELYMSISL